jgi:hypothetical protein
MTMVFLAISIAVFAILVCGYSAKFMNSKPAAILFICAVIVLHHFLLLEALGKSKPFELEFLRDLDGAKVIAFDVTEESIEVWLSVNGKPMAYSIEYSVGKLAEIYSAMEAAGPDNQAVVRIQDHAVDEEPDMTFHPPPIQATEPK